MATKQFRAQQGRQVNLWHVAKLTALRPGMLALTRTYLSGDYWTAVAVLREHRSSLPGRCGPLLHQRGQVADVHVRSPIVVTMAFGETVLAARLAGDTRLSFGGCMPGSSLAASGDTSRGRPFRRSRGSRAIPLTESSLPALSQSSRETAGGSGTPQAVRSRRSRGATAASIKAISSLME